MPLPPLPAPAPARPAFVVLGLVGAVCGLQVIAMLEIAGGLTIGLRALVGPAFSIVLAGLLGFYHFSRLRRDAELTRSELRYRMLAQESTDLIVVIGAGSSTPYIAPGLVALLGYGQDDAVGVTLERFVDPEDRDTAMARLASLSTETPRDTLTIRLRHRDGSRLWVEARLCRIEQADGLAETIVTMQDVTHRFQETEDLRQATLTAERARQEADQANTAKTEFLAHMSHEIRTPLNSVIGFAGLLLGMPDLPPQVRLHVERIQGGGSALLTVVNDILDFSQVEAGRLAISPHPFALGNLIDECLALVQPAANAKALSIHVSLGERLPAGVLGDAARLRQILLNLLNNAIKFTQVGSVQLDIRPDREGGGPDSLRFAVIDTGIGIEDADIPRLFKRFAQVDASIRRTYGGTGLGLAICQKLVALMGGDIGVTSERESGSTFWFRVPLPPARIADATAGAARHDTPVSLTLLLVDDVAINQDLVRQVLEPAGHTVDVVCNGAEAIMAVQDRMYDLVLMDIQMPYLDGLAATRMIRSLPHRCRDLPIVAMTANVLPAQTAVAIAAGMTDVIHKPFSAAQIHAMLAKVMTRTRTMAPTAPQGVDVAVLAKLAGLIGDAKVKSLLAGLAASLAGRFDADPMTVEGRASLRRQAHASVAGSGMLGFGGFAASCKAFEMSADDGTFVVATSAMRVAAALVVEQATNLSEREAPLTATAHQAA